MSTATTTPTGAIVVKLKAAPSGLGMTAPYARRASSMWKPRQSTSMSKSYSALPVTLPVSRTSSDTILALLVANE